jgi:hypothetical protein
MLQLTYFHYLVLHYSFYGKSSAKMPILSRVDRGRYPQCAMLAYSSRGDISVCQKGRINFYPRATGFM